MTTTVPNKRNGNGNRRKTMTEVPQSPNGLTATEQEVERSLASFVAVSRERDALAAKVDVLDIDLQAKEAEIKALREMLTFSEEQMKLRFAEADNRMASYRNERDLAVAELARSEQQFEDLFKSMVGCLQAFKVQGGELVKKATAPGPEQ
jgi:hypothetical protein